MLPEVHEPPLYRGLALRCRAPRRGAGADDALDDLREEDLLDAREGAFFLDDAAELLLDRLERTEGGFRTDLELFRDRREDTDDAALTGGEGIGSGRGAAWTLAGALAGARGAAGGTRGFDDLVDLVDFVEAESSEVLLPLLLLLLLLPLLPLLLLLPDDLEE